MADVTAWRPSQTLLDRSRAELAGSFPAGSLTYLARAPARLDVMGGIADYTGSLVALWPLGAGVACLSTRREDRDVQLFSFNLLDDHQPFQLRMPLAKLAEASAADLRRELSAPGRRWAGYLLGVLWVLGRENLVDLKAMPGLNLAVLGNVPLGGGVSSSAAVAVAVARGVGAAWDVDWGSDGGLRLARLCQQAENEVAGSPCGVMDQVACSVGQAGRLLRLKCQPHDLQPPLDLPDGVAVVGINTGVKHNVGGGPYGRTRAAAFIGRRLIHEQMHQAAGRHGRTLTGDPLGGYLANLDPPTYKALFRPTLPEAMAGGAFINTYGRDGHGDAVTPLDPDAVYPVQRACDHHVLEMQRVTRFCQFLEEARDASDDKPLRSAGHLMYASHRSYGENAGLGCHEADLLVEGVKAAESAGLFGARITGGGAGGSVAVLFADTPAAREAIDNLLDVYRRKTNLRPTLLDGSSPGAWHAPVASTTL